jgi:RNA polymerase sigma-70 factor (ECF subfamily)
MPKEDFETLKRKRSKFIEKICQNTWKELYRYIYYRVQNREEAEDITQETYERALNFFLKEEKEVVQYDSYLKTISLNIIRDRWRKKQRGHSSVTIEDINPEEMATEDFSDSVANQAVLQKAMKCLTDDQQLVIRLRIIEGYSAAETAGRMNKKEGTVRVLQYRAIKALAEILENMDQKEELF